VNAAADRAVITITADHPSRGDAWVVRRTVRRGNVDDEDNRQGDRQNRRRGPELFQVIVC